MVIGEIFIIPVPQALYRFTTVLVPVGAALYSYTKYGVFASMWLIPAPPVNSSEFEVMMETLSDSPF